MKSRRLIVTRYGGPEVLQVIGDEIPVPRSEEILVRVEYSGVAYGDTLKRRMKIPKIPAPPFTPGYELVGVVERIGEKAARRFKRGDRVAAFVGNGANADYVNVPDSSLVPIPAQVTSTDALCLVLNYVTAYQMMHRVADLPHGGKALIHGAAGGVGTAFLQLAALHEIQVYGTASKRKHEVIESLGGIPIDYREEDFGARILREHPQGLDAVFDPIGGVTHLKRSYQVVRRGGCLVAFGISGIAEHGLSDLAFMFGWIGMRRILHFGKSVKLYGIDNSKGSDRLTIREDLEHLMELLAKGRLKPVIGAIVPLERASKAHRMVENSETIGKVLLQHFPV